MQWGLRKREVFLWGSYWGNGIYSGCFFHSFPSQLFGAFTRILQIIGWWVFWSNIQISWNWNNMQNPLLRNLYSCEIWWWWLGVSGRDSTWGVETIWRYYKRNPSSWRQWFFRKDNSDANESVGEIYEFVGFLKVYTSDCHICVFETVKWIRNKDQPSYVVRNLKRQKLKLKKSVFKGSENNVD